MALPQRDRGTSQRPQESADRGQAHPGSRTLYRQQGRTPPLAQLDYVLQVNPGCAPAVVTRWYIFLKAKQYDQAAAILKNAIEPAGRKDKAPAVFYLMLAAVENEKPPA